MAKRGMTLEAVTRLNEQLRTDANDVIGRAEGLKLQLDGVRERMVGALNGEGNLEMALIELGRNPVLSRALGFSGPTFSVLPIDVLDLENRTADALARAQILTIGGLLEKTRRELRKVPRLGEKGADEIEEKLALRNIQLRAA